ncbi:hypothetical protein BDV96DRAFT_575065 [Lophiotrema nucula]|uniref:Cora-like Mg2+ transporter protein-domain-containing protein n=1 Tax=Lophiotrema nucula TaxID=690887 RepID=A0A6A5Z9V3_9PLEO|nr:hypothetical protein BDV96DRAFT_575065 [Lophiotrema nucula]
MSGIAPYHKWIQSLIKAGNANLKYLEEKAMRDYNDNPATCTILKFTTTGSVASSTIATADDFQDAEVGQSRRLFLVEGFSQDSVENLGTALDIEPEFFASQLRATKWEHHDDRSDAMHLPYVRKQARFWTLEYLECIRLNGRYPLGRTRLLPWSPAIRRLHIRNPYKDQKERYSVGLLTRLMSLWVKDAENGNFDAVLLLDLPLKPQVEFEYDTVKPFETVSTSWSPYGGRFIDFAALGGRESLVERCPPDIGLGKSSLKEDLIWRLQNAASFVVDGAPPVYVIPQLVALSNWTLTLAFLRRDFYSLNTRDLTSDHATTEEVKAALNDLQDCRSLLDRCNHQMWKNIRQLGLTPSDDGSVSPMSTDAKLPNHLLEDWIFIWRELRHWINETDRLLDMRLANLSILDSKRSRDDSKRAARIAADSAGITKLGQFLVFVYTPASFAYGILSMGDEFLPGKSKFWVFFVVAIPLSLIIWFGLYLWVRLTSRRKCTSNSDVVV